MAPGSSLRFRMVAAGAGVTRLLVLLLMVAAAPSRARGSGCRVGGSARGVSASGRGGAASCGTRWALIMNIHERVWFAWNLGCLE